MDRLVQTQKDGHRSRKIRYFLHPLFLDPPRNMEKTTTKGESSTVPPKESTSEKGVERTLMDLSKYLFVHPELETRTPVVLRSEYNRG